MRVCGSARDGQVLNFFGVVRSKSTSSSREYTRGAFQARECSIEQDSNVERLFNELLAHLPKAFRGILSPVQIESAMRISNLDMQGTRLTGSFACGAI